VPENNCVTSTGGRTTNLDETISPVTDASAVTAAEANVRMLRSFSRLLIPGLAGVFLLIALTMIGTFALVAGGSTSPHNQIIAIHSMQIGITMTLALVCLFLGAAMCWFGVTGTYSVTAKVTGAGEVKGQGTHVGMILLAGGILLTALTLQKTASFVESSPGGAVNGVPPYYVATDAPPPSTPPSYRATDAPPPATP
jgi:hypothetical protein